MIKPALAGVVRFTLFFPLFFLLAFANDCLGQLADNFSDGDLTANHAWIVDDPANWLIENAQLRSNSMVPSSTFAISTSSGTAVGAQWEFLVNLKFNTSGANYVDVFLMSDKADLKANPTGYFVRIGGTPDEVNLFKSVAGTETIIIDGTDGRTNSSNNLLRIKVMRSVDSAWLLYIDNAGGEIYVLEGSAVDSEIVTSNYFGIRVTQSTSSFFGKHYFDDFYAGEIINDTSPPSIQAINSIDPHTIEVIFDEELELLSAEALTNYSLNQQGGQPMNAALQSDLQSVRLEFGSSLVNLITYSLTVNGVTDVNGNAIEQAEYSFLYYEIRPAEYKDIVITEIFPDPSPSVGLPDAEFIEIYNRSDYVYELQNWSFTDGSSIAALPAYDLFPGDFLIITSSGTMTLFAEFGNVIGIANFPTLNNSSDNLKISDADGRTIEEVSYSDSWYRDDDRKQGGYTLELIDPENICSQGENWAASDTDIGGTPGAVNSIYANNPDLSGPKLMAVIPVGPARLRLTFNENLERQVPLATSFFIQEIQIFDVNFNEGLLDELIIDLQSSLESKTIYTITVSNVFDCAGNGIDTDFNSLKFGLPEVCEPGDVLISELLFNPRPFGADFVEFYNASEKILNVNEWAVGNYTDDVMLNPQIVSDRDYLVFPHEYLVVTADPEVVTAGYPKSDISKFLQIKTLPSFNDDEGSVALSASGGLLDFFKYDKDMHSRLLRDDEGVSLERISFEVPASEQSNWQSTSSTVGFATPGLPNSSLRTDANSTAMISIEPEIFEPLSGQPSFTQIMYNLDKPGYVANISILNQEGRLIKEVAANELLGTSGFFTWDGATNEGTKARYGYYIVLVELFDLNGRVERHKKRVVVASRL